MKTLRNTLLLLIFFLYVWQGSTIAQERIKARLKIDPEAEVQVYDRMIFGQFIEHFHRQVYGGIFEPGSPLSDEQGFRKDVIEAIHGLKVPIVQ